MDNPDITVFVCGQKCEHKFDGPIVEFDFDLDGHCGETTTCAKCGAWAVDVSPMEILDGGDQRAEPPR